ncbi:MAG TPA: VOC family protein [Actinomycetes bacterium]|nr:VOC family protein [Actinomycetes bacterium]
MIFGIHAIVYSRDAAAVREFVRDVLGLGWVDAGGGWPVFALPPAELAVHPTRGDSAHELYLMCDDIHATVDELHRRGVVTAEVTDQGWGLLTRIELPGGAQLGLYEPRHASPLLPAR